jgi:hypothetical protein
VERRAFLHTLPRKNSGDAAADDADQVGSGEYGSHRGSLAQVTSEGQLTTEVVGEPVGLVRVLNARSGREEQVVVFGEIVETAQIG